MSNTDKQRELVSLWEMKKVETIEEFYKCKFDWVHDNLRNEILILEPMHNRFLIVKGTFLKSALL